MKMQAFSIYDSKSEAFSKPFFDITRGSAVRGFSDAVNDETTQFNHHPGDFTLFAVGAFDDEIGKFIPEEPVSLGIAVTFKITADDMVSL